MIFDNQKGQALSSYLTEKNYIFMVSCNCYPDLEGLKSWASSLDENIPPEDLQIIVSPLIETYTGYKVILAIERDVAKIPKLGSDLEPVVFPYAALLNKIKECAVKEELTLYIDEAPSEVTIITVAGKGMVQSAIFPGRIDHNTIEPRLASIFPEMKHSPIAQVIKIQSEDDYKMDEALSMVSYWRLIRNHQAKDRLIKLNCVASAALCLLTVFFIWKISTLFENNIKIYHLTSLNQKLTSQIEQYKRQIGNIEAALQLDETERRINDIASLPDWLKVARGQDFISIPVEIQEQIKGRRFLVLSPESSIQFIKIKKRWPDSILLPSGYIILIY